MVCSRQYTCTKRNSFTVNILVKKESIDTMFQTYIYIHYIYRDACLCNCINKMFSLLDKSDYPLCPMNCNFFGTVMSLSVWYVCVFISNSYILFFSMIVIISKPNCSRYYFICSLDAYLIPKAILAYSQSLLSQNAEA